MRNCCRVYRQHAVTAYRRALTGPSHVFIVAYVMRYGFIVSSSRWCPLVGLLTTHCNSIPGSIQSEDT